MSEGILMDQPERAFYFYIINVSDKKFYNTNNSLLFQRSLKVIHLQVNNILRFKQTIIYSIKILY